MKQETSGLKYDTIESLKAVVQMDRLNNEHAVVLMQTNAGTDLQTIALPYGKELGRRAEPRQRPGQDVFCLGRTRPLTRLGSPVISISQERKAFWLFWKLRDRT